MAQKRRSKRLLVLRLSAMGDVVMTLPVLREASHRYPETELVFVSQPFITEFIAELEDVRFVPARIRGEHKGWRGLWRLAGEISAIGKFDDVADLHGVLRVRILLLFLLLRGAFSPLQVAHIRKGRAEKRRLTRTRNKQHRQLTHSVERYADCFNRLGFPLEIPYVLGGLQEKNNLHTKRGTLIGVAPFAKHKGKAYPLEKAQKLVSLLRNEGYQLYLFGGPGREAEILREWATKCEGAVSVPDLGLSLYEETKLMASLNAMIAMDSGNMHLASWAGTQALSIWGATHPHAGFLGWGQERESVVERQDLTCRPCSVYGNKPCHRGDYACLDIDPQTILERLQTILKQ